MAKLILEDGGQRRAFRVQQGKLTIGSADGCTLTLASAGVEPHHATLVLKSGSAVLRTVAGAPAPLVDGEPAGEMEELPARCTIEIGDARLSIEQDAAQDAPASGGASRSRSGGAATRRQAPAARSSAGAGRSGGRSAGDRPQRVTARRREVEKGMPTWLLVLLLLGGGIGVAFGTLKFFESSNRATVDPSAQLASATTALNKSQLKAARSALDKFAKVEESANAEQLARARELRGILEDREASAERDAQLILATQEFEARIKRYKDDRLSGNLANRARARVFVMRCRDFRERYPDHQEIDWIDRYEARYAPMAKLDQPRTLEDLEWEVKTYTWANPRDYEAVFQAIDEFLEHASGGDREAALALRDQHLAERVAHHEDRMQQMRHHYRRGETGKMMALFVHHLTMWGDEEMENEVAREITQRPEFAEWLNRYKVYKPDAFREICENEYVREIAEREGLL